VCRDLAAIVHFVVALENTTNQRCHVSGRIFDLDGSYDMHLENYVDILPNMGRYRPHAFFQGKFNCTVNFANGKTWGV